MIVAASEMVIIIPVSEIVVITDPEIVDSVSKIVIIVIIVVSDIVVINDPEIVVIVSKMVIIVVSKIVAIPVFEIIVSEIVDIVS